MAKQYRTARGKGIDLSQILNENEHVRAVGNMNVNARGDTIDSENKSVQSRNQRVKNQYRKQHKNAVVDDVVPTSKRHAQKIANTELHIEESKSEATRIAEAYSQEKMKVEETKVSKPAEEPISSEVADPNPVVQPTAELQEKAASKGKGGLAAAIAKARESKQEVMKTERQQVREEQGVKRI